MRISDWSSDVCSADLLKDVFNLSANMCRYCGRLYGRAASRLTNDRGRALLAKYVTIGRASCRERVCPYVSNSVGVAALRKLTGCPTRNDTHPTYDHST